jgi:hypothetical protein
MARLARYVALVAFVAVAASGCPSADCAQSADIQVTVAPHPDVAIPEIARLHVMLSVADGPVRVLSPDIDLTSHTLSPSGSAFVLHPDPAPSDKYDVSMTVQALDSDGNLIAIGSESIQAVSKGCNRMTVQLVALPVNSQPMDMAVPPGSDLAGALPSDMTMCVGGMPDEDNDGRANFCDLCPADADPTPVDTDGDGLPDACDPDPAMGTNTLVYFEPMDVNSGHWSGANAIAQSYMTIDTQTVGTTSASNSTDMLPLNVRVQTIIFPTAEHGNGGGDTGVFVGTNANVNQANGAFCGLTWNTNGPDTLDLYKVTTGGFSVPATQQLATPLQNTSYRIRLTHRAGVWTCEALQSGQAAVTVTTTQTPVVTAPLYMSLINDNMGSHFHSVVAETKL